MTSWPKRIKYVHKIIENLTHQTRVPDEIHLWLAEEEFANKENDLPAELMKYITDGTAILHWLQKNTYLHKRHEIFRYTSDDDLVFFFDDDLVYKDTIIEEIMKKSEELKNKTIINYNLFSVHKYKGKHVKYTMVNARKSEYKYRMWCGHSMIPAKLYPKFLLEDEYVKKRDLLSPISEECWLQPWLVWLNTPITCMNFKFSKIIEKLDHKNSLGCWYYKRDEDGLSYKDKCLYAVLNEYNFIYEKYKKLFNYDCE